MTPTTTRAEITAIMERLNRLEKVSDSVVIRVERVEETANHLNKVVIIGNGEPSHREVIRMMAKFLTDNEKLPEEVRTQGRWIQNINKLGWAIIIILLGILVTNGYNVFFRIQPPTP